MQIAVCFWSKLHQIIGCIKNLDTGSYLCVLCQLHTNFSSNERSPLGHCLEFMRRSVWKGVSLRGLLNWKVRSSLLGSIKESTFRDDIETWVKVEIKLISIILFDNCTFEERWSHYFLSRFHFVHIPKRTYRISANSFRGNYSFLNLALCTMTFGDSTYRCGNYSRTEIIRGNTVFRFEPIPFWSHSKKSSFHLITF